MKKAFIRLLSVMMVACMLLGTMTPFAVFAADTAPEYAFRETFSGGSINTSGKSADIEAAKGFGLLDSGNCTYTLENDTLKLNSTSGNGAYIDLRFNATTTTKDLTQDFVLSFWIKPDTDTLKISSSGWTWYDAVAGNTTKETGKFHIENGNLWLNGVEYTTAHLDKDKWSLVEIVFNYDESATSWDEQTGATTSYTLMLNGEEVATANATNKLHNISWFRIFRYSGATYEIDDLTVSLGNKSLIDIPRTSLPGEEPEAPVAGEYIYREEFGKGFINTRNMASAIAAAGGFWANVQDGSAYNLDGGSFNYTKRVSNDFVDLRFYINGNTKDMAKDLSLSFWINPTTDNLSTALAFGENGVSSDDTIAKISGGKLLIGGADSGVNVPANQWSHIEIFCDYDSSATSTDGKSGAFTSFTVRFNGETVKTTAATTGKVYHALDTYRLFRYSTVAFSIDDLTISEGLTSTYALGRSTAPVPFKGDVVFFEDFSDSINADSSESAIVAAKGLVASHANGTTYNVEGGTFNYVDNKYRDYIGLELWHEGAKIELSQDFVLSYKVKSATNTNYRMYWTDHRNGSDEHSFRHWTNRIRICDELKSGGITNPNVFTKPGEWDLIELFFHYDENATAVTGEKGAFTFYSVYVNGEYVQSTKTFFDFHVIDEFKLFSHSEDPISIDDLAIAYGNVSLGDGSFDDGWEKMDYFVDAQEPADYDYSICVVGDTQVLSAFIKDSYNKIYDWIVDNHESKNMLAVLGLGDVTSNDTEGEWETASAAINKLMGLVPFTVIRGNHDGDAMLNKYFNNAEYKAQFGGFFDENNVNTFWMPLTAGSDKYIVIGLDYGPTHDELAWAENVVKNNPDHKIIITTHSYMDGNGIVMEQGDMGTNTEANTNSGEEIWEKLGRKYANIEMILCGHMEGDYISVRQDTGDNGNVVTQMMINPQWIDDALPAGTGIVTMFYFNEGDSEVTVRHYSTVEKSYFLAENQFTFDLNGEGGSEGGDGPEQKLPEVIYRNDFTESLNTTNNVDSINAANGMWNKFTLGTEYSLAGNTFNYITKANNQQYFELRYYEGYNSKDLKRDFIVSFWMKPTSADATYRVDMGTKNGSVDTKIFAVVNNVLRINNVKYNDVVLTVNEWSLIEIVAHYDAAKGGTYAYTVMLNGEVVDTVNALVVHEEVDRFVFLQSVAGTFSLDNLIIATGTESLINTLSPAPIVDCEHTYDNACDTTCNLCATPRKITHDYTVTDKNGTQHWKKCSVCGTVDESTKADHEFDNACDTDCACGFTRTITHDYSVTDKNDAQHWKKCSVCGTVDESTKADHEFDNACDTTCECGYERTVTHNYTVTDKNDAQHWKKCSICGTVDESTKADHEFDNACDTDCACGFTRTITHDYSVTDKNDTQHWKKCSVCGTVDESTKADHEFNNACDTDCACGFTRAVSHNYKTEYETDGSEHWIICSVCGDEKDGSRGRHEGGEADCVNKAECSVCGNEYGSVDATEHVGSTDGKWYQENDKHYKLCQCGEKLDETACSGGEATCGSPATCDVCGNAYGNVEADGHVPSEEWYSDGTNHWKVCTVDGCGAKVSESECYGSEATCEELGVCYVCGNDYGELADHVYSSECDGKCDYCEDERTAIGTHKYQDGCDSTCNECREVREVSHVYANDCDDTCDNCLAKRTVGAHVGGTATCEKGAVCTACGREYGDKAEHKYLDGYNYNSVSHWKECTCGSKKDEAAHTFTKGENGLVTCTCGYTVQALPTTVKSGLNATQTVAISLGCAVGLGGVAAILAFLLGKKKLI